MPASALGDVDPLAPVFFLSYTRATSSDLAADRDADLLVVRLFNDLVELLNPLVARQPGAVHGFIDRGLTGGQRWEQRLLDSLGKCQVFVALTSVPYYASEYCGKEWDGFSRRTITHRPGRPPGFQSAIVPVVWAPNYSGWTPPVVSGLQLFSPGPDSYESAYREHGIFGLLKTGKEEEYNEIVWRLARHIANIFYSCRVESCELDEASLRNVFQNGAV